VTGIRLVYLMIFCKTILLHLSNTSQRVVKAKPASYLAAVLNSLSNSAVGDNIGVYVIADPQGFL